MGVYVLTPIGPADVDGRKVMHTGVSMVGLKGDDYLCGHCGKQMLTTFNLSMMQVSMVYQCGVCDGYNVAPKK